MGTNLRNGIYAVGCLFIAQGETGDTSQLYKSDDSLLRQTHAHTQWPCWSVNWLNDVESESPPETRLLFAYGKNNPHALHQFLLWDKLHIVLLSQRCYQNSFSFPKIGRASENGCWYCWHVIMCTKKALHQLAQPERRASFKLCCGSTKH